tara:strand:- start:11588 stop:12121 length:534 start_codon:yes stop_codon:yes gene_type:complete
MTKINRVWAMPNKNTFSIKPIREFIFTELDEFSKQGIQFPHIIDPFANINRFANITNDIDPQYECNYTMDALDFLKMFHENTVDIVLYDPPYSPRQVSECYKKLGMTVNMETTQASYWSKQKKEIARIIKVGGKVLSFGWNSGGIGKTLGFELKRILLVAHGGRHNDTICTMEIKSG